MTVHGALTDVSALKYVCTTASIEISSLMERSMDRLRITAVPQWPRVDTVTVRNTKGRQSVGEIEREYLLPPFVGIIGH